MKHTESWLQDPGVLGRLSPLHCKLVFRIWFAVQDSRYSPCGIEYKHPSNSQVHPGVISLISGPTSLTEAFHDAARAELLTLQCFHFHQKYKSASEIFTFENETPCRPVGNFLSLVLNHWLVWQRAELGPLPPVSWWKITMHPTVKLVGSPLLCRPT